MIISAIAAIGRNRVLGKDNDLPWHLPADFKHFKRTTLHHHCLMGRKTFESFNGALPKRVNIVVTRDAYYAASGATVVHSIEEGIALARDAGEEELFVLGGGNIYEQCVPLYDRLYLTHVDAAPEGDTYFPEIDYDQYRVIAEEVHPRDHRNEHSFTIKIYEKTDA